MASKPALRNLLMNETKVNFIISASAALVVAAAYKFGVEYRRKKKIEDFFAYQCVFPSGYLVGLLMMKYHRGNTTMQGLIPASLFAALGNGNYDLDASYKRMKAAGVFQLYNPDKDD